MQKIRRNRQITATDLAELERIFVESGIGTVAEVERVKTESGGLGVFLRSLTGLDRDTAVAAFETFQRGRALTSAQLRFVGMVIDHLAHSGAIAVDVLYDPPFTALAPGGPEDLFAEADVDEMVATLRAVNATAVPA